MLYILPSSFSYFACCSLFFIIFCFFPPSAPPVVCVFIITLHVFLCVCLHVCACPWTRFQMSTKKAKPTWWTNEPRDLRDLPTPASGATGRRRTARRQVSNGMTGWRCFEHCRIWMDCWSTMFGMHCISNSLYCSIQSSFPLLCYVVISVLCFLPVPFSMYVTPQITAHCPS